MGRKKDMIVSGGFNVFPSEVENVIAQHSAIAQVSVFGTCDEKWGEAVTAAVVLRSGESVDADTLRELVREHKGPVQTPNRVELIEAIPQTAVGKPDKKALRKAVRVIVSFDIPRKGWRHLRAGVGPLP